MPAAALIERLFWLFVWLVTAFVWVDLLKAVWREGA